MKKTLILAAIAVLFAACNKNVSPLEESPELIILGAEGFTADVCTKVDEVTSLDGFYVTVTKGTVDSESTVWNNAPFTVFGSSTPATYAGGKYWPVQNLDYHFYASNVEMNPATIKGATIPATNDTDVVAAHKMGPGFKVQNTLNFEHIFARIGNVSVEAADGYTITGVSIRITPNTGGTYDIKAGYSYGGTTGWSNITTGSPVVISGSTCPSTNNADLYLIAGQYTLTASWTASKDEYSRTYTDKTVSVNLLKGNINNINCVLGGNASAITLSVNVQEWATTNYNANFPIN
ncbi:MAG: hypothetical protein J5769_02915 [Bacteroidales bacterium]|nr:hypothetical protein [Bacteroidales bacterium]